MSYSMKRLAASALFLPLALWLGVASAQAAVTASTISSPANDSRYFFDNNGDTSATLFTVTGTTTGDGNVDIDCYDGATSDADSVKLTHGPNTITAVATDADGISSHAAITVTDTAPAPVVTLVKAGKLTASSARLSASVNPEGQATTYEFEYGTTTAYKSHTKSAAAGSGGSAKTITATIKGLEPHTTYHYRLVASSVDGTTTSTGRTFRTAKPAPRALGAKVSPDTAHSFPYSYTVKGKLSLPNGISAKAGCSGKITLTVKRGHKKLATAKAKISTKCTWMGPVKLTHRGSVPGTGKLAIIPSFGGNAALSMRPPRRSPCITDRRLSARRR
jgi:hypothetical protein